MYHKDMYFYEYYFAFLKKRPIFVAVLFVVVYQKG